VCAYYRGICRFNDSRSRITCYRLVSLFERLISSTVQIARGLALYFPGKLAILTYSLGLIPRLAELESSVSMFRFETDCHPLTVPFATTRPARDDALTRTFVGGFRCFQPPSLSLSLSIRERKRDYSRQTDIRIPQDRGGQSWMRLRRTMGDTGDAISMIRHAAAIKEAPRCCRMSRIVIAKLN